MPSSGDFELSTVAGKPKRPLEIEDRIDPPKKRQRAFTTGLAKYSTDDAFTDFEIFCRGVSFRVHRLVISVHSGFFERLCKNGFKEDRERKVDLSEDPIGAVALMINYFYNFDYTPDHECLKALPPDYATADWGWFTCHMQMSMIADKYDVPELKGLAEEKLDLNVTQILCRQNPKPDVRAAAKDLIEAVRYHYEHTGPGGHCAIILLEAFVGAKFRLLRHADKDVFRELLQEIPDFAADYIAAATCVSLHSPVDYDADNDEGVRS